MLAANLHKQSVCETGVYSLDIDYLQSYRSAKAEYRRWSDNLKEIQLKVQSAGVTNWDSAGGHSGNYGDALGDKVVNNMEEYDRTLKRYLAAIDNEQEIADIIKRVVADAFDQDGANKDLGLIIQYRYIDFMTPKKIAWFFDVGYEQIQQWENEALAILEQYDEKTYVEQYRKEREERRNSPEIKAYVQQYMEQIQCQKVKQA